MWSAWGRESSFIPMRHGLGLHLCAGLLFWQSGGFHTFLFVIICWFWYNLDSLSIVGLHFRDRVLIFQEFFRSLRVPTSWMGKLLCTKIYGGLKSPVALWSSAKGGQTLLCMGDWSERCLLWGRGNLSSLDTWQTSMSVSTLSCSLQPLLSFQGTSPSALMKSEYRKTLAGFVVVEYSVVCFRFLSCHIANFAPKVLRHSSVVPFWMVLCVFPTKKACSRCV